MLNILIISQHFPPDQSGNSSRIYDLSKQLVILGCNVTVISPFASFPHGTFEQKWKLFEKQKIDGITHISIYSWNPIRSNPSFIQRTAYYLLFPLHSVFWALSISRKFEIIVSTSPPIFTGIPGIVVQKLLKKKFVYDFRDLWIQAAESLGFTKKESLLNKLSRNYEKYLFEQSDLITVTTDQIKKEILQVSPLINESKIQVVANGVDTSKFITKHNKFPKIIYAGNIGHAQDLLTVIKAVKKVNERIPLNFLIVGDGDLKTDLQKYVEKNDLNDIITFTNRIERKDIPDLISECMIGIAPLKDLQSLRYALPTKVYEYMAAGIPFIATGKGEIELLAQKSKAGLISENTVASIEKNIELLLNNAHLSQELGKNGREYAKKYCDRKSISKQLLKLLKGLY